MNKAILDKIDKENRSGKEHPDFSIGDTIKVHIRIKEGDKERIQVYAGTLIARDGTGATETITVRRVAFGEGVERVIPIHSPVVEKIEVARHGQARRAKLYYLRDRVGKRTRVKERKFR